VLLVPHRESIRVGLTLGRATDELVAEVAAAVW
jgi:hypothetical protein